MYTTTYTSVYNGNNVSPAFPQYTAFTLSASIELSWPLGFQNLNMVVSVNMDITPTAGGFTVKMPDATGAGKGFAFEINNPGAFSFNLIDNSGNLILTIAAGTARKIWLIDNSTISGTWRTFLSGGGGASVTSVNATSVSDNLVISGVPIISAGTINFTLAKDLLALTSLANGTGISVRTAADTWALRSIQGTVGEISVINPSGIAGNITLSLSPVLANLTSVAVGNLFLSANTISSTNGNGAIILAPQGTGLIQLSKNTDLLTGSMLKFFSPDAVHYISFKAGPTAINQDLVWPSTTPATGQLLGHTGLGQLGWFTVPTSGGGVTVVSSIARYSNSGGSLTDSSVLIDNSGNVTGMNSCVINDIILGQTGSATITTQLADQALTISPNGIGYIIATSDLYIRKSALAQSSIRLYDNNTFYAGLMANPAMTNNFTWTLPATGGTAGYLVTDAANTMSIRPLLTPLVTVVDIVPKFSDTVGTLGSSVLSVSGTGVATGLTSCIIGSTTIGSGSINTTGVSLITGTSSLSIANTGALNLGGAANTVITLGGNVASTIGIGGAANTGITLTTAGIINMSATGGLTTASATSITNATASTSPTTGALTVTGGLGITLKAYIASNTVIGAVSAITQEQLLTLRGTPSSPSLGPHISAYANADTYPLFQNLNYAHDTIAISFDCYFDGSWRSSFSGSNFQIYKFGNQLQFNYGTGITAGSAWTQLTAGYIDTSGQLQWQKNVSIGSTGFGGGVKVLAIGNATTVPTAGPGAGVGGVLYVEAGALKYRGGGGTITTIAVS